MPDAYFKYSSFVGVGFFTFNVYFREILLLLIFVYMYLYCQGNYGIYFTE